MDIGKEIEQAKSRLIDELLLTSDFDQKCDIELKIDVNIDGVQLFKNLEKADKETVLKSSTPILLGYYHGFGKPNFNKCVALLLADLKRLYITKTH